MAAGIAAMAISVVSSGLAEEPGAHRSGFAVYARVERPDDTHRNMMVDIASLDALRVGQRAENAVILMESFSGGRLTSVFVKRREQGEWVYGAIRPGEGLDAFRPGPYCASCHRAVSDRDGMFTGAMLEAFVNTGMTQNAFCDRPGRSPCGPDVYRSGADVIAR